MALAPAGAAGVPNGVGAGAAPKPPAAAGAGAPNPNDPPAAGAGAPKLNMPRVGERERGEERERHESCGGGPRGKRERSARVKLPCLSSRMLLSHLAPVGTLLGARSTLMMSAAGSSTSVADWPSRFDNSLLRDLQAEPQGSKPHSSREVRGAHFTLVRPTVKSPSPRLVALAPDVALSLGLDPDACASDEDFLKFFAGSPPESVQVRVCSHEY